jgi:cyclophilin family peptidyl-prolyl cis-trans isomerase
MDLRASLHLVSVPLLALCVLASGVDVRSQAQPPAAPDPVLVLETAKGAIQIQLFRNEAPKSVEHVLALVKRSFYRGQRFHRVTASLAQVGDPQSRDMSRRDYWGNGNSGSPIGVFEWSKKRSHVRGAVGLAHSGSPLGADSQFYIMKSPSPSLDGKHAIVGQVTSGLAVVDKLEVTDMIKSMTLK